MSIFSGLGGRGRGLFSDTNGPWGPKSNGDEPPEQPRSPWGDGGKGAKGHSQQPGASISSIDDFLRKSRARWSPGGGLPGRPNSSLFVWGAVALVVAWLLFTSFHIIAPEQRGVVTLFGRYVRTLEPGVGLTLPSPIERVEKLDVNNIRTVDLGSPSTEDLMLTGDQNIIDIAYSVRWNIRDPEQYLFEIARPTRRSGRWPKARCARWSAGSRWTMRSAIEGARSKPRSPRRCSGSSIPTTRASRSRASRSRKPIRRNR
jgi:membrane protease subunit HflK